MGENQEGSSTLSEDGHLVWVSSKVLDVLLDPLEGHHLVLVALISWHC